MATEVDRLIVTLEARLASYEANMRRGQLITNQRLGQMESRFALFSRNVNASASTAAVGLTGILGGLGAYLGVRQLQDYADGWNSVARSVSASEEVFGIRLRSASELNKLAKESRVDLEAYSKLYVRTAAATRELGLEEEKVAKVTSTVAMALKLGGASATEQASTLLQLSQALNKGKLDGDEFRTVMENAVIIQELLAKRLGVTKGEIIKFAAAGKLVVKDLIGALIDGGDQVERIFKKMPATIGEAFVVLRNSMLEYVGNLDKAYGASKSFMDLLASMSRNLDNVANGALVVGAALLGAFGGGVITSIAALAARLATIPGLILGASAAALSFGRDVSLNLNVFNERLRQGADNATALRGAMDDLRPAATTVSDQFRALVGIIGDDLLAGINTISAALGGQEITWADLGAAAIQSISGIYAAVKAIGISAGALPKSIALDIQIIFETLYNKITGWIEAIINAAIRGVNAVISATNQLPEYFVTKTPLIAEVKLDGYDVERTVAELDAHLASLAARLKDATDTKAFVAKWQAASQEIATLRAKGAFDPVAPITPSAPGASSATDDTGRRRSPFAREVRQVEENIRALTLENKLIGANAVEADTARTALDLLNAAKQEGIAITPELLAQIDQLSRKLAEAKDHTELLKAAMEDFKATSKDVLKGFISDLKDGKSGTEALAGALNKLADKLLDMAVNQLVNNALGPLVGGLFGGGGGGTGAAVSLFAKGGIAAHGKPLPTFAGGGVSKSAAIFGEAGPEAAVPLPDGRRIPVDLRLPTAPTAAAANSGPAQITVAPVFNVQNGTPEGIDKLKREIVPMMRQVAQGELAQQIDRHPVFAPLRRR